MSIISRLSVVLGLDTAEFNAGLGKAEQGINKFGVMATGLKTAVVVAGAAFAASSYKAIEFADSINDIAKANEMAVSSVLEFSQALQVNGGQSENATRLLSGFTNKIDEAAQGSQKTRDKFKELGVSLKDLGTLSEEELMRKTVKGLAAIDDPIRRNAAAFEVFGKAIKGVDIKGLNDELQRTKGSAQGSDEAFGKIGDALDKLDKLSFQIKTDLANNLAQPFYDAIAAAERFYNRLGELREANAKRGSEARQKIIGDGTTVPEWWKGMFGAFFEKELKDAETKVNVFSSKMQEKIIPSILGNGLEGNKPTGNVRDVKVSDEQLKLQKAIESQKESLNQSLLTMIRQTEEVYGQKSMYEQISQEFEKGGKFDKIKDESLKNQILQVAKMLDMSKEDSELKKEAQEKAKALATHDLAFERSIQSLETDKERYELQIKTAGLSDTQKEKMLAIFDMEAEIVRMKKEDLNLSDQQVQKYRDAKMAVIETADAAKRMNNTFQAGWSNAMENFKEKASDSFSLGQDAFNSMTSSMSNALDDFVSKGKISFSSLIGSMISDLLKLYMKAQMSSMFGSLFGDIFGGGGSGGVDAGAGAYSIESNPYLNWTGKAAANGGDISGPTLVGERGPELFIPKGAGTVIPNNQLSSMMGGGQQVIYNGTVIQNMSAIDTQSGIQFLAKNKEAVWAANMSAQRGLPTSR